MKQIIGHGAEAIVYKDDETVIKDRIGKGYRHPDIDKKLRKSRTRREAKILEKLALIKFPGPRLKSMCDKEMLIQMEFIKGEKLRDILHTNPAGFGKEIGRKVGILHRNDIIHADLTTSNMIMSNEIFFIDFGLSFFSKKVEDKAVDLHLLNRALESGHYGIYKACFDAVIEGYKESYPEHSEVFSRLEKVELRGRNRKKP